MKTSDNSQELHDLIDISAAQFETLLPYHAYDEATMFFINDKSVGFGFEMGLFSGANEDLINKLLSFINRVVTDNEKTYIQFIRWCTNKVGADLDAIKKETSTLGGIFASLAENSDDYFRYAALEGFPNRSKLPVCLRDNRLYLFVSKEAGKALPELFADLESLREDMETDFRTNQFEHKRMSIQKFLSLGRDWLNPDADNLYYADGEGYLQDNPISTQLKEGNFELFVTPHDLNITVDRKNGEKAETTISSFYINRYPDKFSLASSPDNFANAWKPSQAITGTFLFSVTFTVMNYEDSKRLAEKKFRTFDKFANSSMVKLFPSYRKAAREWDITRQENDEDMRKLVFCQGVLVLFSPPDKAKAHCAQALSCFDANGFKLVKQKYIQLPLYLSAFPFMTAEGLWADLKKFGQVKRMRSSEVVSILPVVGDFRISRTGLMMPSFRHQFSCFNLFDKNLPVSNRNVAVAGYSGGGKSFLIQAMLLDVLSQNGFAWIIDKGESYRKTCQILGGAYIDATSLSLNPFSFVSSIEDEAPSIRDLISVMASPDGELTSVQLSHLLDAVNMAFLEKKTEANIDTVVKALAAINQKEKDRRISDMMVLLKKYTTEGQYGRYFNTRSKFDPKEKLTVLELSGFEKNDELLRPVLYALIIMISELTGKLPRDVKKFIIIDEAWALFKGDNKHASRFIEDTSRTIRKYGGSICSISQRIQDYFDSPEAEALWDNSSIKLILKQQNAAALKVKRNAQEVLSIQEQLLAQKFPFAKTGYSAILIKTDDQYSFNRLLVDPYKRIMLTTDPEQYAAIERLVAAKTPLTSAVMQVARDYYGEEMDLIHARIKRLKKEVYFAEDDAVIE